MIILSDDAESSSFPVVNWLLILFNVSFFFYALCEGQATFSQGVVPTKFIHDHDLLQFGLIFAAMFAHSGFLHLFGNMWALYLFGDNVEDKLGHFTYLAFYLACGVFAAFLHIFANATSTLPCVGASGAIAGVMGAYVLLYPNASCKAWFGDDLIFFAFRTYKIPATLVIGGWFLMQLVLSYAVSLSAGGIAFHAHIGGFVAGMVLTSFLTRGAALPLAAEIPAVERHSAMDFYKNPRTFAMMGLGLAGTLFALYHPPRLSVGYSVALPPSAATPAAQTSHAKPKRIARAAPRAPKTHTPHAHQNSKNTVL